MTARDPRGLRASGSAGLAGARADSPLLWNVAGLLGEAAGGVRDYSVAGVEIDGGDDFQLAAPIDGHVRVTRTNRGLLVDAGLTTALASQCVRCLRDITVPMALEIRDEALPSLDLKTGKAATLSAEDAETGVIVLTDHHELDL
ncbi:MAG: hypothetical protein QOH79_3899, partial [Acidimicrobiaceae bacterium]